MEKGGEVTRHPHTYKKTLILTLPPLKIGGVQAKALILADHLRKAGHDGGEFLFVPLTLQNN